MSEQQEWFSDIKSIQELTDLVHERFIKVINSGEPNSNRHLRATAISYRLQAATLEIQKALEIAS
jgi:hypothetical protein